MFKKAFNSVRSFYIYIDKKVGPSCSMLNYGWATISFVANVVKKNLEITPFLEKERKYILVGNKEVMSRVKTRIDFRNRGFSFWKPSNVTVINENENHQIDGKGQNYLMICNSVESGLSPKSFYTPVTSDNKPARMKQTSLVIAKTYQDSDEQVKRSIKSLRSNTAIQTFTPIEEFIVCADFKLQLKELFLSK